MKAEIIEKLVDLLEKINGFFSIFCPFKMYRRQTKLEEQGEHINSDDLSLASKIFRVIHGHKVVIRLIVTMEDLLAQALQCYSGNTCNLKKGVYDANVKKVASAVPMAFSWAYRIISKFTKHNSENKEIMVKHASEMLPAYGAMF